MSSSATPANQVFHLSNRFENKKSTQRNPKKNQELWLNNREAAAAHFPGLYATLESASLTHCYGIVSRTGETGMLLLGNIEMCKTHVSHRRPHVCGLVVKIKSIFTYNLLFLNNLGCNFRLTMHPCRSLEGWLSAPLLPFLHRVFHRKEKAAYAIKYPNSCGPKSRLLQAEIAVYGAPGSTTDL